MRLIYKIIRRIKFFLEYYLIHGADPALYLRTKGAKIGSNCDLLGGIKSFGTEPYLIRLGKNVTIAGDVLLLTHDGASRIFRSIEPRWHLEMGVYGIIDIGNDVFIGAGSIILPGVIIGSNVIVGAGSVVTKNVESNVVVAGNPARVLCTATEYRERAIEGAITISDLKNKRSELEKKFWQINTFAKMN